MLDKKTILGLLLIIILVINSCVAGDNTLKCYSRLVSDSTKVRRALYTFWENYPENRVDEATIIKVEKHFPNLFKNDIFKDTNTCFSCRSILRSYVKLNEFERESWYIKSSNNELIFCLEISNVGAWINGYTCDICLIDVMYLNDIESNFKNWQLIRSKKIYAKKTFKIDVLPKLIKITKSIN
jgi:hypothetical protein